MITILAAANCVMSISFEPSEPTENETKKLLSDDFLNDENIMPPADEPDVTKKPGNHHNRRKLTRRPKMAEQSPSHRKSTQVKQVTYDSLRSSSAHGISHAATAPSPIGRKFWTFVSVTCIILMFTQLTYVILKFLSFEKAVSIQLNFERAPFPAVTICNLNPFKRSLLENVESAKSTLDMMKNAMGDKKRHKRASKKPKDFMATRAACFCSYDSATGLRRPGTCVPASDGLTPTGEQIDAECICIWNRRTKRAWDCYPESSWQKEQCIEDECTQQGYCPMPGTDADDTTPKDQNAAVASRSALCYCNDEFNYCVMGEDSVPAIEDLVAGKLFGSLTSTTTTTTQAPAVDAAMGYSEMTDSLAITTKGKENLVFATAALPLHERKALSYKKSEMIMKCSYAGSQCDIERDFKIHADPTFGNCFTFNWNQTQQRLTTRAGPSYGLRVLVYVNVSDYLPTSDAAGIQVAVHGQSQVPFPDAYGAAIPVGSLTSLGITRRGYRRLPHPYGKCYNQPRDGLPKGYIYNHKVDYSIEGCYRSCFQQELIKLCGCGDPRFPAPKGNVTCSPEDPIARTCLEEETEVLMSKYEQCECLQPCTETTYPIFFSTAVWPSGAAKVADCKNGDKLCQERYRRNAAMVQVFYEQLNYEVFEETPTYTFVNVLADFGGTMGLWLGVSVVTTLEVVILMYNVLRVWNQERRQSTHDVMVESDISVLTPLPPPVAVTIEPEQAEPPDPKELIADWLLSRLSTINDPDFKRLITQLTDLSEEN